MSSPKTFKSTGTLFINCYCVRICIPRTWQAVNLTSCLDEGDGEEGKLATGKQPPGGAAKRITSWEKKEEAQSVGESTLVCLQNLNEGKRDRRKTQGHWCLINFIVDFEESMTYRAHS